MFKIIDFSQKCKCLRKFQNQRTVQRSALCRSRQELSNEYLLAKIGVDTAENEPLNVTCKFAICKFSEIIYI